MTFRLKSLTDKITIAFIYLLTAEIAVALALAINFMYDYHFFMSDSDTYPVQKAMSQKVETEYDSIIKYVTLSVKSVKGLSHEEQSVYDTLSQKYSKAESNIVFYAKDENENIILTNDAEYDTSDSCYSDYRAFDTYIEGTGKMIGALNLYVRGNMTASDSYRLTKTIINIAMKLRYVAFVLLFVLIVAVCFFLGLIMFSVEKRTVKGRPKYFLNRIPFDILSIIIFIAVGFFLILIVLSSVAGIKESNIVLWNALIMAIAFFNCLIMLAYCISIAARVKEGHVIRNTVIYKVISRLKKKTDGDDHKFKMPFLGKALLVIGLITMLSLALIFIAVYKYKTCESGLLSDFNFLFYAFSQVCIIMVLGATFFLIVFNLNAIKENGEKIARGDYERIPDSHIMFGDFKAINDDLISIKNEMITNLEEKNKNQEMRNELITNLSHDIKTPLTSIVNYADIISSGKCSEEDIATYSNIIKNQSARLKTLLSDLIDMSKISSSMIEAHPEPTNLNLFVAQALEEFAIRFSNCNLETQLNMPEYDAIINADGALLWRVFENIFGNCCKYAMPNTRVYIDISEVDKKIYFSVKNVAKDKINVSAEDLLIRFKQNDTSRHTEGHGLGLSIAKSFTELQGGELNIFVDGDLFKIELVFDKSE